MDRRLPLQTLLESVLGTRNVYFQPPEKQKLAYPAIVYELDDIDNQHGDNTSYIQTKRWQVTLIDPSPTSATVDKIARLPRCSFTRHFAAENLNHTIFSLYF